MTMTRSLLRELNAEINGALEAVAERHGLVVSVGGGSFSSSSYRPKVEFKTVGEDGVPEDFAATARLLGLPEDCYGKTFTNRGRAFTVRGFNLRAKRYPVLVERDDGRTYKFDVGTVKWRLEAA